MGYHHTPITADPALLPTRDETFADLVRVFKGNEDAAFRAFVRNEAHREANAKVQRDAIVDAERDGLSVYLDLGPISDLALKCQRMDYSYTLIRCPSFRDACEARAFGTARAAETYTLGVAA